MRLSRLFFTTLRDDPADAEMASHRLLVRAGYVRQLGPASTRSCRSASACSSIEQIIREEIDAIGGQEMKMPVVHPADMWKRDRPLRQIGPEMARFKDRPGATWCWP